MHDRVPITKRFALQTESYTARICTQAAQLLSNAICKHHGVGVEWIKSCKKLYLTRSLPDLSYVRQHFSGFGDAASRLDRIFCGWQHLPKATLVKYTGHIDVVENAYFTSSTGVQEGFYSAFLKRLVCGSLGVTACKGK